MKRVGKTVVTWFEANLKPEVDDIADKAKSIDNAVNHGRMERIEGDMTGVKTSVADLTERSTVQDRQLATLAQGQQDIVTAINQLRSDLCPIEEPVAEVVDRQPVEAGAVAAAIDTAGE